MECEEIDKAVKIAQEQIMDKKRIEIDFDFFRDEKLQVSVNCILRSLADSDAFQSGRCAEHNGRPETPVIFS